MEENLKD